jgi:hypothetical protein
MYIPKTTSSISFKGSNNDDPFDLLEKNGSNE